MSRVLALSGILGPVVTPFARGEELDLDGFRRNVRAHIADGLAGVVLAGSTGEAALLTEEERLALVSAARPEVPADRWLIVGTGGESTRQCVTRCRAAKAGGADAALVVAPHYYSNVMGEAALRAHYTRVADESPLPVILYNIPKYAHFGLSEALVGELARHPNVIGIKDSSGAPESLAGYLRAQGEAFTVLTGSGSGLLAALQAGARGGIVAVSLFAAALALEVLAGHRTGDAARAAAAQARLVPMANVIVAKLGVAGVKAALDQVGRVGGRPRLPLLPLTPAECAEMVAALGAP
ncbi:MAG: dihydrodipicolinate synthase family protein [Gemmatimonadaceae bacterium]